MLTILSVITLEGWTDLMYKFSDSDSAIQASIFFILLVLFGSFFLLNLILAVIMEEFDKNSSKEESAKYIKEVKRKQALQEKKFKRMQEKMEEQMR